MATIDNPFLYEDPEWLAQQQEILRRKEELLRREKVEQKLGRPLGTWGGKRTGAGRPKSKEHELNSVKLKLTRIQKQVLMEMGKGDINYGVMALINEHI